MSVHSCGPNCQKPLCVANRRIVELTAVLTVLGADEDLLEDERYPSAEAFFEAEVQARKDYAKAALKQEGEK